MFGTSPTWNEMLPKCTSQEKKLFMVLTRDKTILNIIITYCMESSSSSLKGRAILSHGQHSYLLVNVSCWLEWYRSRTSLHGELEKKKKMVLGIMTNFFLVYLFDDDDDDSDSALVPCQPYWARQRASSFFFSCFLWSYQISHQFLKMAHTPRHFLPREASQTLGFLPRVDMWFFHESHCNVFAWGLFLNTL